MTECVAGVNARGAGASATRASWGRLPPCTGRAAGLVIQAGAPGAGRILHHLVIDAPAARPGYEEEQEDEAIQDGGITAVEQREETLWCMGHEVGHSHVA